MRLQLFYPRNTVLGPDVFNQLFTIHGTTMVFMMGMPILIGMGNYLVPLMIGARDMAFPRLNAMGFWATLFGGIAGLFELSHRRRPAIGWFALAPLTENTFARSAATDLWALGLIVNGVGTIAGGSEFHRPRFWECGAGHAIAQSAVFRLDDSVDRRADRASRFRR